MKKETQKRIEQYKAALPGIKERIVAVAVLLAMSVTMMVTASYAWLTISKSPDVTGTSTTLAGNGNLEIALVGKDGAEPGESKVGDSFAAQDQSIVDANLTWGNLINLSDTSYGLSNIVLRPALLNTGSNLLDQPLKGADYGDDGRVELYYNEDFQFVNWVEPSNGVAGYFKYFDTTQYGIRAISTVQYTYVNNSYYQYTVLMKRATGAWDTMDNAYTKMLANEDYIDALAGLIGDFMTDKLNDKGGTTDVSGYMTDVYNLMIEFEGVVESFADALVALANVQVYNKYGPDTYETYTYTKETLLSATTAELKANGVVLDSLDDYLTIRSKLKTCIYGTDPDTDDGIQDFYNRIQADKSATVTFNEVEGIINTLVNISSCQIICNGTTYTVGSLGVSAATKLLGNDVDAVIAKGVLKDFEQLTGCAMYATEVDVSAKYIVTVTMTAKTITTSAAEPYTWDKDVEDTAEVAASNKGDYTAMAQDTYGMAIDFWIRTNAANSFLILEGNVLTETESVRATGLDQNGNTVELYTVTITTTVENEDGTTEDISESVAVYYDSEEVLRDASNHSLIYNEDGTAPEGQTISDPKARMEEVVTVIGYEGENRIWQENALLDVTSTTQGSGSCYVFYAEDPAQQENSLRLLSNLRVAFIDSGDTESSTYGRVVGMAKLDIDNAYEENGKVTLPLVLTDDGSNYLTKNGDELAIYFLQQNVATRLTAIIYLDGREMSNADVLAANDIQGQLNIQFGSTHDLDAIENEDLEQATRSVSAVASRTANAFGGSNSLIEFSYDDDDDLTVHVKLTVDGEQPNNVTAFFMRRVNSTQGSREDTFTLTQGDDGCWYGSYTFDAPGEYVLRTVRLDGVDYDLPSSDYPQVKINGFTVKSVSMLYDSQEVSGVTTIMTGNRTVTTNLSLTLASDQKLPSTVQLQMLKDDGTQVTANMTYNITTGVWSGNANITTSGTYTLKYVIMDGEYTELDSSFQSTLIVYAGITVSVDDGGTRYHNITWEGEAYTVPVYVEIYDDTGAEIKYLSGTKLVYTRSGSNVDGMNPDLKWSTGDDCYTGNLLISGPGIYTFNSVTVGSNVLKNTTGTTPTYTCVSPEPPSYYDAYPMEGMDYLLSTGSNTIQVGVRIANAEAATVTAVLMNLNEKNTDGSYMTHEISATAEDTVTIEGVSVSTFLFTLPTNAEGYRSGNWVITELWLADVYDEDSNYYSADDPMVWDLSEIEEAKDDDLSVEVVNVKMTISGTDEGLDGGSFMGTATATNSITLTITDQRGNALKSGITVSTPKIVYKYTPKSSEDYGGYYSETADGAVQDVELTFTVGSDGKTYTATKPTFVYAGVYTAHSLTFTVSQGTTASKSFDYVSEERASSRAGVPVLDMPKFTLTTAKPTVKISTVSTNASTDRYYTSATPGATQYNSMITGSYNSKIDDYNAVVYMYFKAKSNYDAEAVEIKYPTVTLSLSGIPSTHSGVTFVVPNDSNASYSNTLTFAAGGTTASGSIGGGVDGTYDYGYYVGGYGIDTYPVLYPAGKQTVDEITVVYNGATYTVELSDAVTINNPLYPPYADFKDISTIESTYTGATPSRVYSQDGETITLTLNKIQWTRTGIESGSDTTYGSWSSTTLHTDYGHKTYSFFGTWNYYMPYYWTEFSRTVTGQQRTYTTTYTIEKWLVDGVAYTVTGDSTEINVAADGPIQVIAVVTSSTSYGDWTNTTSTEYMYGYVAGSETSTKPGGKQIGSSIGASGTYPTPSLGIADISSGTNVYSSRDEYLSCTNRAS